MPLAAVGTSTIARRQAGFEPGSMKKEADRRQKFRTKNFMKTRLHFLETTCILSRENTRGSMRRS